MTEAKVRLGERLFSDARLSRDGSTSCATCHQPDRAFTDGRAVALGVGGTHPRNTPTLWNVAYNVSFTWVDAGLATLEAQHLVPLTGSDPVEMGFDGGALAALQGDVDMAAQFEDAFPGRGIELRSIVEALASYVRTLVKRDRPFDRYLFHDEGDALSVSAKRGLSLFFSERLGCARCHAGPNLSGPVYTQGDPPNPVFHITGVGGSAQAFRAPSLKFLRETSPYMHDGSLPDLAEVVRFYESAQAERLQHFTLTATERADLIQFLNAL